MHLCCSESLAAVVLKPLLLSFTNGLPVRMEKRHALLRSKAVDELWWKACADEL